MTTYGLTVDGFTKKPLEETKTELENALSPIFDGVDADDKVTEQIIGTFSSPVADLWDLAEGVYNSQYPRSADGIALANIAALIGVYKLGALPTSVTGAAKGNEGTVVPLGQLVKIAGTNNIFVSAQNITISRISCVLLKIVVDIVSPSTVYSITVNDKTATVTSGVSPTNLTIIAALVIALIALSEPVIVTDNLDGTIEIRTNDFNVSFGGSVSAKLNISETWSKQLFNAQVAGATLALANTLTEIQTPIDGWLAVNNFIDGKIGREVETDTAFRIRRRQSVRILGAGSVPAIRARLRQEVAGVREAFVYENPTSVTDIDGRPPKSIECVVAGGTDDDIANKIWQVKGGGIQTYGDTTVIIIDEGDERSVSFSRPTAVYIWIRITLTLIGDGSAFPDGGLDAVKSDVLALANDAFGIGNDVLYEMFYGAIFQTKGISKATIELATSTTSGGPPGTYVSDNILIDERSEPVFDSTRVMVNE